MINTFQVLFGRNPNHDFLRGDEDPVDPEVLEGYPPMSCFEMSEAELAEAQQEGDTLDALYASEAAHCAASDARFTADLTEVLEFLNQCHGGDDCDGECPAPVEVLTVHKASKVYGHCEATVKCSDGTTRRVRASYREFGGSYLEPPDVDVEYEYVPEEG